jgi:hypothetical protein
MQPELELEEPRAKRLLSGAGLTAEEQVFADNAREARIAGREERKREQRQHRERDDSGRFTKDVTKMTQDEFNAHLASFGVSRYICLAGANR